MTIITQCAITFCSHDPEICSEIPLLYKDTRHVQITMHLHPLKDIIRCAFPACYFHFCAFRAIDRCGCTLSLGRERHPPQLHHQNHLAPSFHKHDRKPPTALTSVDFSFKETVPAVYLYSMWCLGNQWYTVRRLVFSSAVSTGSLCSF